MRTLFLQIFWIIFLFIPSLWAQANTVDVSWNVKNRELIYDKFFQVTHDLNDLNAVEALKAWTNRMNSERSNLYARNYLRQVYQEFKTGMKSRILIDLMAHYYFTKNKESFISAITYYYWQSAMFLYLNTTDPRQNANENSQKISQQGFQALSSLEKCLNTNYRAPGSDAFADLKKIKISCIDNNSELQGVMKTVFDWIQSPRFRGAPAPITATGFISGNKVEQLTQNNITPEHVTELSRLNAIFKKAVNAKLQKKYVDMSIDDFKNAMPDAVSALSLFTEEGLPASLDPNAADGHPSVKAQLPNGAVNIFGELYNAIGNAKKTIYIDVYFFGGSMGAMFAKKIIQQLQQNSDLKVMILNDRNNAMTYDLEMQPVYNFLRAYAEKFGADRMLVLVPRIDLKRTSLPSFVDLLISDEQAREAFGTPVVQSLIKNNKIYPKAKSDHSKVYLMDAFDAMNGLAFVGSKNITDTSGGIAYDEVTKIQGPAVPVIQDSFYYDIQEAIFADEVFGKIDNTKILDAFDLLGRTAGTTKKNLSFPAKGNGVINVSENNVYGSIRDPLTQDIAAIMDARQQIIISDQFVYDPYIVKALIEAKRAAAGRNERLDIYVLLATINGPLELLNPQLKFAHIPNMLFLKDMLDAGIQIRWKTESDAVVKALQAGKAMGSELSPEYHLKTISIDGVLFQNRAMCENISNERQVIASDAAHAKLATQMPRLPLLISGSANKDNMTMIGGFREFQVGIYDKKASSLHDCLFWSRWASPESSREVKVSEQFQIPENFQAKGITNMEMLEFLKEFFLAIYNFELSFF